MIIKTRQKPLVLKMWESLNYRIALSEMEQKEYAHQIKGFSGEQFFDSYLQDLSFESLVLNDLRLEHGGQMIQIDSLLLAGDRICLYEVKNYSGSYEYQNGLLQGRSDFIVTDPLTQVQRSLPVLHHLIRHLGYQVPIDPYVVFVNPEFYLYQLPRDKPFLFVHQLSQHFERLTKNARPLSPALSRLAGQLIELHNDCYRPPNLPHYDFSLLKKGVLCPQCFSFVHTSTRQNRICSGCNYKETASEAIKRSAEECQLIYPKSKITKDRVYQWCGEEYGKQRIQRVLAHYFPLHGHVKSSFYDLSTPYASSEPHKKSHLMRK